MSAPSTVQRMPAAAPGTGYPQPPANQTGNATHKADLASQLIKKITDLEVSAYSARVKNNTPQNGPGLIPVALQDRASGAISYITVNGANILKFAAAVQLKKLDNLDVAKRAIFIEILGETVKKLNGLQVSIICACEPEIKGQLLNSKLIKAIVVQAAGL